MSAYDQRSTQHNVRIRPAVNTTIMSAYYQRSTQHNVRIRPAVNTTTQHNVCILPAVNTTQCPHTTSGQHNNTTPCLHTTSGQHNTMSAYDRLTVQCSYSPSETASRSAQQRSLQEVIHKFTPPPGGPVNRTS